MVGLGIALIVAAVAVELRFRSWRWAVVPALLVGVSGIGAAVAPAAATPRRPTTVRWWSTTPSGPPAGCCCWTARRTPTSTWPTPPI